MRILIQRVKEAYVDVDGQVVGKIGKGVLVFLGLHKDDTESSIPWLVNKLVGLRVFEDEQGKMNLSVKDIGGEVLVVSQFTLYGNCMNGRRPDFISTMRGEDAEQLYDRFVKEVQDIMGSVQSGQFGANMQVHLVNDGPVTFMIER
ncbi:MAG: D-aminoacyl-tRNA deacylase [Chlamydiota bacterium]